jgi:hypothetical protein
VQTVHDLITQIDSGIRPREKKTQSKIVERRLKELYDRFNNKKITVESLLQELNFFVVHQKKIMKSCVRIKNYTINIIIDHCFWFIERTF